MGSVYWVVLLCGAVGGALGVAPWHLSLLLCILLLFVHRSSYRPVGAEPWRDRACHGILRLNVKRRFAQNARVSNRRSSGRWWFGCTGFKPVEPACTTLALHWVAAL